eukprot:TRINITY_DN2325_c0_g2_i3.p1 TRINITY_DN2325_c0_g2~~TRINITY_DN2325_c0_g2_i3.p1  ORF type:complete len:270 (-),score=31.13 TRINITY_DN2325_c0_g2_i3:56-865(-)
MEGFQFDADTKVVKISDNVFRGRIVFGWSPPTNIPYGGYIATIALRAFEQVFSDKKASVLSIRFIKQGHYEEVDIQVYDIVNGRRLSSANCRIVQKNEVIALVRTTFISRESAYSGHLDVNKFATNLDHLPPSPENCRLSILSDKKVDLRITDESSHWLAGNPSDRALIEGWCRFTDGRDPDWGSLAFFADAFPLSGGDMKSVQLFSSATYELTVFFRQEPKRGWLRGRLFTKLLNDAVFDIDAEIFDVEGNLVAQAKQLCICKRNAKL